MVNINKLVSLMMIFALCSCNETIVNQEYNYESDLKTAIKTRFLKYVSYDTQSNASSEVAPSTQSQLEFAQLLVDECIAIGLSNVSLCKSGIVMATLPGNTGVATPTIGFLAHMDTSPDASGKNVVPRIWENYDGNDIVLDGVTISPAEFSALSKYIGKTIITASGNTLLGADNKAGIAIILTAMEYLLHNPQILRNNIRVAFTPDEEIGRGTANFDVAAFGADFAYTVDGGGEGALTFENFNAAMARIEITGRSIHPGTAKGIMKNSALIAADFIQALPADDTPAHSSGYEGFFHLTRSEGMVEKSTLEILIRCFDEEEFEQRKKFIADLADTFNEKYGAGTVKADIREQYLNMRKMLSDELIDYTIASYNAIGIEPVIRPTRGGTDGARLSYMGLPCPNIFTGGYNYHGPYEFVVLESMVRAVDLVVNLAAHKPLLSQ
jgi:tripeptide aminopeptidase